MPGCLQYDLFGTRNLRGEEVARRQKSLIEFATQNQRRQTDRIERSDHLVVRALKYFAPGVRKSGRFAGDPCFPISRGGFSLPRSSIKQQKGSGSIRVDHMERERKEPAERKTSYRSAVGATVAHNRSHVGDSTFKRISCRIVGRIRAPTPAHIPSNYAVAV